MGCPAAAVREAPRRPGEQEQEQEQEAEAEADYMRTATTLARGHDGKWALVAGPDVPIVKQLADFRGARVDAAHKDIAELRYQDSDGLVMRHVMLSPKDFAAREKLRKSENAAAAEAGKKVKAADVKPADPPTSEALRRAGKEEGKETNPS